jgi:hypothetical protein
MLMLSSVDYSVVECKISDKLLMNEEKFLRKLDLKLTHESPQSEMVIDISKNNQFQLKFSSGSFKTVRKYYAKAEMFRELGIFFRNLSYIDYHIDNEQYFTKLVKQGSNLIIAH